MTARRSAIWTLFLSILFCSALLLVPTHSATAQPFPEAHWPFEGNADDASGNGHHGTLVGGPEFVPGCIGQGLQLGEDKYVEVPDDPPGLDDEMTELTIELWLWLDAYPSYQTGLVAKYGPGSHEDDSYILGLSSTGKLALQVTDGRGSPDIGYSSRSLQEALPYGDGQFHHIAATWSAPNDIHIYLDGEDKPLDPPYPEIGHDAQFIQDTDQVLWIGNHEHSGTLGGWLYGIVDEVKIYDAVVVPPANPVCGSPVTPTVTATPTPTCTPVVGGTVEMQVDVADSPASLADSSGAAELPYAAIAGAAAAALVALGAGGWYARRRWAR
jgi:hypothetical protein